ncbi:restriction endonuclease subunit S [Synechococcus sp. BDU 130192]|uniref:restriction endonuclease subunit S n=1 Tax=Synechococcus sp. BDU 130192 TaxID=2042059 RepID=UPI000C06DAB7|nr:restriction endonuclease subunit S [Synechococcus sp. BDU 130192]
MNLKTNWELVPLEELAIKEKGSIRRGPFGGALKKENFVKEGYLVYEQQHAIGNDFSLGRYFIDELKYKEMEGFNVLPDDLIISCARTIGRIAIAPHNARAGIINQALMRIRPDQHKVLPIYLKRYLESPIAKRDIFSKSSGSALKNLAAISEIKKSKIPLPPIAEQRRIAAILDKADEIRRKRSQAIQLTEDLGRSLFLNMFGDPVINPKGWEIHKIEDVSERVTDGTHHTPIRSESGIKLLSARNIQNGFIDIDTGIDFIPINEYERLKKRYDPKPQDLLISCSGSVGRVSLVRDFENSKFSMVRSVASVRPDTTQINPEYLESFFHSEFMQRAIKKGSKKSSQANLFQGAIKELPVLLPPLQLQKTWERRKKDIANIRRKNYQYLEESENFFNSLLQRAFRGEL